MKLRHLTLAALASVAIVDPTFAQTATTGPSTTTEPYVLGTRPGVNTVSVLTTGDSIGGYRMVGVPDGLGLWAENSTTFNMVSHHELGRAAGVTRSHGSTGAFVSRWNIQRGTFQVLSGRDQIASPASLFTWDPTTSSYVAGTTAFERFCSADLAKTSAFFQSRPSGRFGTQERIFLSGEETSPSFTSDHGRSIAHILTGPNTGKSYEVPRLGKASFENAVASPFAQLKTVVMLQDDGNVDTNVTVASVCRAAGQTGCAAPPSEVYMYVGTKQLSGNEIERAGLTNGNFYGLKVRVNGSIVTGENPDFVFNSVAPAVTSARFEFYNFGNVANKTGVQIQDEAITNQVFQLHRDEDGAWDPRPGKERDYYFVTTGRISTTASTWRPSRLWRLRFDDIANPEAGGTITMLLTNQFYPGAGTTPDNDPTYQMFDNITIDSLGRIVLLEDVGNNARLGRVYVYGIDSGNLTQVAVHNEKFFKPGGANFQTIDEETSGVIDAAEFLGSGWFMLSVQNHRPSTETILVEGGQYVAMFIDPSIK
jgi:hypothetical protein